MIWWSRIIGRLPVKPPTLWRDTPMPERLLKDLNLSENSGLGVPFSIRYRKYSAL